MTLPHRRQNLLTGDWVLVSPHRAKRPWQGQEEPPAPSTRPAYDPGCYLCPGNTRANGVKNPSYAHTHVFDNDFPALLDPDDADAPPARAATLFREEPVRGTCRVICFSPRHDLTLADLDTGELLGVIDTWAAEVAELRARYRWVQVFENKGAVMGCSNPHPHGQIWALDALPNEAQKEQTQQNAFFQKNGASLLLAVAAAEQGGPRVVLQNDEWQVIVPHWALWPFETLLLPLRPAPHLDALDHAQRTALAPILSSLCRKYDQLFGVSFPYSMGWHGAPGDAGDDARAAFQLHAHFYPPLLRSASVKKFMVGYEMLGEGQRDLTPEQAAERLRACPDAPLHPRSAGEP